MEIKLRNTANKTIENNRGITLIALVITIIVLLILAGVTIATLTGDNGLLQKATNAKEENEKASDLEKIELAVLASYDESGEIDTLNLSKNLSKIEDLQYINDENELVTVEEDTEIELPGRFNLNGYNYKINSEGKVTTKKEGNIDNEDIMETPSTYYGKYVTNYTSLNDAGINANEGQKWQIFFADETNIYLIASKAVSRAYVPLNYNYDESKDKTAAYQMWFNNVLSQYNTSTAGNPSVANILGKLNKKSEYHEWLNTTANLKNNDTEKAVLSMLDTDKWNEYTEGTNKRGYKNSTYAQYAIGGPTLEMFCKSYNPTHEGYDIIPKPKRDSDGQYYSYGYKVQKGDTVDNGAGNLKDNSQTQTNGDINAMQFRCNYWIASPAQGFPSNVMLVTSNGEVSNWWCGTGGVCFRPIVCLKSDVHFIEKNNGTTTSYEVELD